MTVKQFSKDPAAVLDYTYDWATWLDDDEIVDHEVTAATGVTVDSTAATTTAVTAWVSGGTVGTSYDVVCQIETAAGRTDERTIRLYVRNR